MSFDCFLKDIKTNYTILILNKIDVIKEITNECEFLSYIEKRNNYSINLKYLSFIDSNENTRIIEIYLNLKLFNENLKLHTLKTILIVLTIISTGLALFFFKIIP